MKKIVPIIEGDGEITAVPNLLSRILDKKNLSHEWFVGKPIKGKSPEYLSKNMERILKLAELQSNAAATLIILDLDDGCPKEVVYKIVGEIQSLDMETINPIAVVLAHREYEAWFLATLETIAGNYDIPLGTEFIGDVESIRDAKGWITRQMCTDGRARRYKETIHQLAFTKLLNFDLVYARSRSFRRLSKAVDDVVAAEQNSEMGHITPICVV